MSQDTGLSVRRPRETLANLNFNSGIPQPPSAMKRSNSMGGSNGRSKSGSRHSIALTRPNQPVFSQSSQGSDIGGITASVKRASIQCGTKPYPSYPQAPFTPFTPGGPAGRSSADAERRSSMYTLSRPSNHGQAVLPQSFFSQAPQAAGAPRDPRPLKDRSYQTRIGQELLDYMAQHGFELEMKHSLSANVIKSPTQKDFNYMFQWLYHRIDSAYRFQKNIDQEVPVLLKQMRYPYEKSITKSQIAAVGGQNWSTFLGLLHWMMQLAQMMEKYESGAYDYACLEAGIDVTADHITFDFLCSAYRDFLSLDVEVPEEIVQSTLEPHVEAMQRAFEKANAKYESELRILEAEHARLLQDIDELKNAMPDAAVLDDHFKIMEEDKGKFEEYVTMAQQRAEKYENRCQVLQTELEKLNGEMAEAEEERRGLQKSVDDQGISIQDIDRMTSDRERLQKSIESAAQRLEEVKRKVANRETEASRKLEELERLVDNYNTLAYQIGMIPASAANAKGVNYELQLTAHEGLNFTMSQRRGMTGGGGGGAEDDRLLYDAVAVVGYQPAHILNLDLRGQIKSKFLALRKEISDRRKIAMDMMMEDHDLLDRAKEAIEDKRNEVETLEHRVRAAEEEYEKTKEVTTAQKMASDAQIEKMEKELARMREQLSESVQLLEQREMSTNIEYEQLTLRANSLREELHTETTRMLSEVIKFKMHVQKSLEEYEAFVTDELEMELGSDEMHDSI